MAPAYRFRGMFGFLGIWGKLTVTVGLSTVCLPLESAPWRRDSNDLDDQIECENRAEANDLAPDLDDPLDLE